MRVCEKDRYHSDKMKVRSTGRPPFDAEFLVADCCEVNQHGVDDVYIISHTICSRP